MNCVRKHLSAIKGGRLAPRRGAGAVVTLMISDVPNDDLSVIASGPTVPDPTTRQDALAVIAKYSIDAPAAVLRASARAPRCETPKPGDAIFATCRTFSSPRRRARWTRPRRARKRRASRPASWATHRGRVARRGARACRHRQADRPPRPAVRAARASSSRAARRRSPCAARDAADATPSSCSACARARRLRRHLGDRLRHRRHRRQRGQRRRDHDGRIRSRAPKRRASI